MTVQELIEKLQTYDPTTRVMVEGYEGGYSDVTALLVDDVALNYYTEWYYGKHETVSVLVDLKHIKEDDKPEYEIIKALILT